MPLVPQGLHACIPKIGSESVDQGQQINVELNASEKEDDKRLLPQGNGNQELETIICNKLDQKEHKIK